MHYASPSAKSAVVNSLDVVILGATEVDTDFNVNVHTDSNGLITEEEREALHEKIRCCANEYVRYIHEHRPDLKNASLIDAMECFGIEWEGTPHTSLADTIACKDVWLALFPNYYEAE